MRRIILLGVVILAACQVHGYIVVGQSNGTGDAAFPVISTAPQHANALMLYPSVRPNQAIDQNQADAPPVVPYVESDATSFFIPLAASLAPGFPPPLGETAIVGAVNGLAAANPAIAFAASDNAYLGAPMADIMPGTQIYANGLNQIRAMVSATQKVCAFAGLLPIPCKGFELQEAVLVNGEQDDFLGTTNYSAMLLAFQTQFQADVQAITGQTVPVRVLISQEDAWTVEGHGMPNGTVPQEQVNLCATSPAQFDCANPKYMMTYNPASPYHMDGPGQRHYGDYLYKALEANLHGRKYLPLALDPAFNVEYGPLGANQNVIHVHFHVPVEPLQVDCLQVSDPGNGGVQLDFHAGMANPIAQVVAADASTLGIVLNAPLAPGKHTLYFGWIGHPGAMPGPSSGPRTCIHDSDPATSSYDGLWEPNYLSAQTVNFTL